MSVDETTTTESTEPEQPDEDDGEEFDWSVKADGMLLAKVGYSTYRLGHNSLAVEFDDLRDPDSDYNDGNAYELRDDHDVIGYFDPDEESVPEEIATAFRVLAGEL